MTIYSNVSEERIYTQTLEVRCRGNLFLFLVSPLLSNLGKILIRTFPKYKIGSNEILFLEISRNYLVKIS